MNTLFQKIAVVAGLTVSFGLLSCQENSLVSPEKPSVVVATVPSPNDAISAGIPRKYTLTKHGLATLTYLNDGALKKVTYGLNVRGSVYNRTEYSYGPQFIKSTSYSGTDVTQEITYFLDANTGRCYESKQVDYVFYSYATVVNESKWVYQYNEKGQLKSCSDKSNPARRTEYTFNADGDLSKVTNYTGVVGATSEVAFAYDQPTGDPILADLYPLNPMPAHLSDPYLKVFGKLSKHLVKRITQKLLPGNQVVYDVYYAYTLNTDGYVTNRKEFTILNAALVGDQSYEYLVTNIVLQP